MLHSYQCCNQTAKPTDGPSVIVEMSSRIYESLLDVKSKEFKCPECGAILKAREYRDHQISAHQVPKKTCPWCKVVTFRRMDYQHLIDCCKNHVYKNKKKVTPSVAIDGSNKFQAQLIEKDAIINQKDAIINLKNAIIIQKDAELRAYQEILMNHNCNNKK